MKILGVALWILVTAFSALAEDSFERRPFDLDGVEYTLQRFSRTLPDGSQLSSYVIHPRAWPIKFRPTTDESIEIGADGSVRTRDTGEPAAWKIVLDRHEFVIGDGLILFFGESTGDLAPAPLILRFDGNDDAAVLEQVQAYRYLFSTRPAKELQP